MKASDLPSGATPRFRRAVEHVLEVEGLFSDHAWDPGGATKYGVTDAVARRHGHEVEDLTVAQAVEIYWRDYWLPGHLDNLTSGRIALEIFDTRVNLGVGKADRLAQEACVALLEPVAVDGRMGPQTRAALNRLSRRYEAALIHTLDTLQGMHYLSLRGVNPTLYQRAIRGWMARRLGQSA